MKKIKLQIIIDKIGLSYLYNLVRFEVTQGGSKLNLINKIKKTDGAVDMVVILIAILIFGAVSIFSFKGIGKSVTGGTVKSEEIINNMMK